MSKKSFCKGLFLDKAYLPWFLSELMGAQLFLVFTVWDEALLSAVHFLTSGRLCLVQFDDKPITPSSRLDLIVRKQPTGQILT